MQRVEDGEWVLVEDRVPVLPTTTWGPEQVYRCVILCQPEKYTADGTVYYAYLNLDTEVKRVMTKKESDFVKEAATEVQQHDDVLWSYLCSKDDSSHSVKTKLPKRMPFGHRCWAFYVSTVVVLSGGGTVTLMPGHGYDDAKWRSRATALYDNKKPYFLLMGFPHSQDRFLQDMAFKHVALGLPVLAIGDKSLRLDKLSTAIDPTTDDQLSAAMAEVTWLGTPTVPPSIGASDVGQRPLSGVVPRVSTRSRPSRSGRP